MRRDEPAQVFRIARLCATFATELAMDRNRRVSLALVVTDIVGARGRTHAGFVQISRIKLSFRSTVRVCTPNCWAMSALV